MQPHSFSKCVVVPASPARVWSGMKLDLPGEGVPQGCSQHGQQLPPVMRSFVLHRCHHSFSILYFFFIWEYYPELGPSLEVMERFLTRKPGLVWAEHNPGCSEPWWLSKEATPTSLSWGKPRSAPTPVPPDTCLEGAGPGSACLESCST